MKTLTFTVEDALLSPEGFAILAGAGLFQGEYGGDENLIHVHRTTKTQITSATKIDLKDVLGADEKICGTAPIFIMELDKYNDSFTGILSQSEHNITVAEDGKSLSGETLTSNATVFIDYYVTKISTTVQELQIDASTFGTNFYVEASTLFKRQSDGVDMPAELTFPNVKIQSNFTFSMASTGDPSTFTFTMDAFPGYTYFNPTRQVMCAMQIVEDTSSVKTNAPESVFKHANAEKIIESNKDSANPYEG